MKEIENKEKKNNYNKRNEFKFKAIFNNNGETLEKIIERAFGNYVMKVTR